MTASNHVEILEFLLEVIGRTRFARGGADDVMKQ